MIPECVILSDMQCTRFSHAGYNFMAGHGHGICKSFEKSRCNFSTVVSDSGQLCRFMSGSIAKMDRVLKLKETESIAVPAMSDYLSVGNNTADNANSHTYVYEPNKSLHQVSASLKTTVRFR